MSYLLILSEFSLFFCYFCYFVIVVDGQESILVVILFYF